MKHVPIPVHLTPLLRVIGQVADRLDVRAYAVGGCVRDWRLKRRTVEADLDVAVEGSGIALARAVARELEGTVTAHEQFGTATLVLDVPPARPAAARWRSARLPRHRHGGGQAGRSARRLDFATCRRETYAKPAAYPKVVTGTLRDDLFRRDFTINAMAVALTHRRLGTLIDPFHGARDLRRRELRILHSRSFLDDPSRLLRGVRFLVRFGLCWEPGTERAAREAVRAGAIGWLNTGRLRKELDRIAAEANPRACLERFSELFVRVGDGGGHVEDV